MKLRGIFFDFDGLITDTESAVLASAASIFSDHGASLPIERWLNVVGTSQPRGFWGPWLSEQTGLDHDHDALWDEAERRNIELVSGLLPNAGVEDLLRVARTEGLVTRVVSSSPSTWVVPITERLGLRPWLGGYTTREDAPRAKPHPDLYIAALAATGLHPDEVIVFEDSANGARAAIDAGLRVIAIPGPVTMHQDLSHAHLVAPTMEGLEIADLQDLLHR